MFHKSLLVAPAAAVVFAVFCAVRNAGPGAVFLAATLLITLVVIQPLLQLALMRVPKFQAKVWDAWFVSVLSIVALVGVAVVLGAFNFW